MKTILVPLDGSAIAERILPYVRTLAPCLGARVCLLRVVSDPEGEGLLADSIATTYEVGDPLATQHERRRRSLDLLRQKIEPDPANPRYILTVRGTGYLLVATPSERYEQEALVSSAS